MRARTLSMIVVLGGWVVAGAAQGPAPAGAPAAPALPDVLQKSFARYAALTSYADTGTVKQELPGLVDEARFTTYFRRATRDLLIDFAAVASVSTETKLKIDLSGHRTVIWMSKGEMQKYDFRLRSHETVAPDNGGQPRALQVAGHATKGVSMLIPSLLYTQARLPSTVLQVEEAEAAGDESIDGRRCHKFLGVAAAYYPSGQRTSVRPVAIWVDAETLLIRRVFEDTPRGYQSGSYLRTTITFTPHANPAIDDAKFQFAVPE